MPIDRFEVKAHWVESYHSKVITESVEPFLWWVDPSNPSAQSMYGILWQALCEHVSEEAIIRDVTINGRRTIETHPAGFLKNGDVVEILIYHNPGGYPDCLKPV